MNKTFKSAASERKVTIEGVEGNVRFTILDNNGMESAGLDTSREDAAAQALAILEAAGYGEEVVTDGSPDGHIQVAKYYLHEGVKAEAQRTAEAKE